MTPRVRFAPSPTGYLHVGGARTALFNWLYARHAGGKFLLRIEDTDKQRSTEEHTKVILDGLTWLGLDWDEDPVFQGARVKRHQEIADRLLAEGKAYMEEGAIRFRLPPGEIAWDDAVHGRISFQGEDLKDFVILRSDRTPIYNFAVVVDDVDMRITHVLRGDDHISNTPKQIALYRALGGGAALPVFGHVPMIHGPDGKKLSKRHGATAVGDYQGMGILSSAMRNFLALLGWSPGGDRELFFEMQDLVEAFSLDRILKKAAVFDFEKLKWMNGEHLRYLAQHNPSKLLAEISPLAPDLPVSNQKTKDVLAIVATRTQLTGDLTVQLRNRLVHGIAIDPDEKAQQYIRKNPAQVKEMYEKVIAYIPQMAPSSWSSATTLEPELKHLAERLGKPVGQVFQPIRIALTGSTVSEPVHELVWAVGQDEARRRLEQAMQWDVLKRPSTSAQ